MDSSDGSGQIRREGINHTSPVFFLTFAGRQKRTSPNASLGQDDSRETSSFQSALPYALPNPAAVPTAVVLSVAVAIVVLAPKRRRSLSREPVGMITDEPTIFGGGDAFGIRQGDEDVCDIRHVGLESAHGCKARATWYRGDAAQLLLPPFATSLRCGLRFATRKYLPVRSIEMTQRNPVVSPEGRRAPRS